MKFDFNTLNRAPRRRTYQRPFTPRIKPVIVTVVLMVLFIAGSLYLFHPPFNWHSPGFIYYLIIIFGFAFILSYALYYNVQIKETTYKKVNKILGIALGVIVAFIGVYTLISTSIFNAKEYASRISVESSDFSIIEEVDFSKTPIIDRDSTEVLGDRVMGEMPELVSQFEVSAEYTQISYRDSVYRVTPLEYADIFKYFANRGEGIPAYILVNSTTGEAELVRLEDLGLEGMRYVPSAMFNENLMRKLQMSYPTKIFGAPSFEIDEDGRPWYICTTYTYKAMGTKLMVEGVVLFDPITGDSTYYDDVLDAPTWVDRIYPESLIVEEFDDYGSLRGGFINSIFGQKDVFVTSEGYNYLEKDGDIWIYSGITSANSDAANLGFVLVNLRTHEARMITSAGANEVSAMSSAEGNVKNYGYHATFPLLVNVSDKPVYLMSLKDDAGLIKMYAMVDATDYQKVSTVSIDEGLETLKETFVSQSLDDINIDQLLEKTITIKTMRFINVEGNTIVYLSDEEGHNYKLEVNEDNVDAIGFIEAGDEVTIYYAEASINLIKNLKKAS